MTRFTAIQRLILPLFIGLVLILPAAGWEEKTFDGRGYVSVNSMKEFYRFKSLSRSGKQLVLDNGKPKWVTTAGKKVPGGRIEMRLRDGSHECFMNDLKFVFSYPVRASGGKSWVSKIDLIKMVDPVLRPADIRDGGKLRTVIIDPGHGGKDPGATNSLGTEARYNLKVAGELKRYLESAGYTVIMTREDDRYLSLQQRVDFANRIKDNAIFVSIHHNSGNSRARGIETFTLSPVGVAHYGSGLKSSDFRKRAGNSHDSANVALATAVHGRLLTTLRDPKSGKAYTLDRGIKRARFSVLSGVTHPAILVECGFMTHPYEARLIHREDYQRTLAKAIAVAIRTYHREVGRRAAK